MPLFLEQYGSSAITWPGRRAHSAPASVVFPVPCVPEIPTLICGFRSCGDGRGDCTAAAGRRELQSTAP